MKFDKLIYDRGGVYMGSVYMRDISTKLTDEELEELKAAESKPIVYDEDCPQMTEEMLKQFRPFKEVVKR